MNSERVKGEGKERVEWKKIEKHFRFELNPNLLYVFQLIDHWIVCLVLAIRWEDYLMQVGHICEPFSQQDAQQYSDDGKAG